MVDKSKLQASLSRLLKKTAGGGASTLSWLSSEVAKKGRVDLIRAGEDQFVTSILDLQSENGEPVLIVDRLLPQPDEDFWNEPVSLQATVSGFDAGMEEIAGFRARVGDRVNINGHDGVELTGIVDFERTHREYVAAVGSGHPIGLSFVWYGSWQEVKPKRMTISRFFFDADLDEFTHPEGYAISQAVLLLEKGGTPIPVKLHMNRARNGEYEAEIEKIDGPARVKLTSIIEEIWRTEAGLSSKQPQSSKGDIGYMKRREDTPGPHILLLSRDENWQQLLSELGTVIRVTEPDLDALTETVSESPSDLFVADADLWGSQAVSVERLLRSVSRYRKIPRLWITSEDTGDPWEASDIILGNAGGEETIAEHMERRSLEETTGPLDHVDYGAFDLIPREIDRDQALSRIRWALGGDTFGKGEGVLLITQDARLRYRIGLAFLGEHGVRFATFKHLHGIIPVLDKRHPRWILLDAASFEVEIDAMLSRSTDWTQQHRGNIIVLAKGASHDRVTHWLKNGARDIVLLDPSLREAMRRLRTRILSSD